MYIRLFVKVAY